MLPLEGAADLLYPCLPPAWQTPMLKVRPYTAQDEVRNRATVSRPYFVASRAIPL